MKESFCPQSVHLEPMDGQMKDAEAAAAEPSSWMLLRRKDMYHELLSI